MGHNNVWKRNAVMLGANPRHDTYIEFKDEYCGVKYVIVNTLNNKIVDTYYRKPSAKIINRVEFMSQRNMPSSTGYLKIFPFVTEDTLYEDNYLEITWED